MQQSSDTKMHIFVSLDCCNTLTNQGCIIVLVLYKLATFSETVRSDWLRRTDPQLLPELFELFFCLTRSHAGGFMKAGGKR